MTSKTTKPAVTHAELTPAQLRWRCELSRIPFETTAQAELREGFIGQEGAARACAGARTSQRIQKRYAGEKRFSAPAYSAGIRGRAFPAAKRAHRRTLYR